MPDIPRRGSARTAKLARIPIGIAGRAAVGFGKKLAGGNRGEIDSALAAKAAEQLFSVLGEVLTDLWGNDLEKKNSLLTH